MKVTPEIVRLEKMRNEYKELFSKTRKLEYYCVVNCLNVAIKILKSK